MIHPSIFSISGTIRQFGGASAEGGGWVGGGWQAVAGVGGLAPGWQRPRPSAEEPEATDNGAYLCQDISTPTHVTSKPPGRTRWGNCTSCPEEGELAPDGGAGSPSPLTPVTSDPHKPFGLSAGVPEQESLSGGSCLSGSDER